jgi:hypothetical protein
MKNTNTLKGLYVTLFTLLIVHEIDSAFWKEWEMFNLPGGIQLFNVIHIVVLPIFIMGYGVLLKNIEKGIKFSLLLSILGIFAFVIHSTFLRIGYDQFKTPVSISIIVLLGIVSTYQLVVVYRIHNGLNQKMTGNKVFKQVS